MMLPSSWEELEELLETSSDPTDVFEAFAATLGTTTECQRCGLDLIDSRVLADEIVSYYDLDDGNAQVAAFVLEDRIEQSSVELADQWAALCSGCESLYFNPKRARHA